MKLIKSICLMILMMSLLPMMTAAGEKKSKPSPEFLEMMDWFPGSSIISNSMRWI